MNDTSPPPLFMNENPVAVPLPRAVQQVYLWGVAAVGALAMLGLFVFGVATQSESDAGRIAGAQTAGSSGFTVLIGHLAATHGRPGAY